MSKDTILVITTSYPSSADGSEAAGAFVAAFARELSRLMPVRVVGPAATAVFEESDGCKVWRFEAGDRPLSLLSPMKPWHWLPILRTLFSLRKQSLAASQDGAVSHVLAMWVLPSGWVARTISRRTGVGYSVWALGSDIWSLGRLPIARRLLAGVSRGATRRYADGYQLARDAEKLSGVPFEFLPSSRGLKVVRQVPAGSAAPFKLLYLGRWHPNKGIDLLFEALDLLTREDWARIADIHIAGGGPLEARVRLAAERLMAAGHPVRLSGYLDEGQASQALAEADRLLLPSRIESIPVIFSDALSAGLPLVSMPVGDLPDLVRPGIGWLAAGVSAADFAAAIQASLGAGHSDSALADLNAAFQPSAVAARVARMVRGLE